jgi:hypothetical protein
LRTAGNIAHGSACCADARTRCTSSCNITRRHGHRTPDALPLPLARALELADRAEVVEPEDHSKRIARLRVEERLLADGPGAIDEAQDALRDAESLEVARRLQPTHRAVLVRVWQAAAALSAALDRERELFAAPIFCCYTPRPDILQRPGHCGAMLGSQSAYDSEISTLRRRLGAMSLLP